MTTARELRWNVPGTTVHKLKTKKYRRNGKLVKVVDEVPEKVPPRSFWTGREARAWCREHGIPVRMIKMGSE